MNNAVRSCELLVFALLVPFAGLWLFPEDPLGLNSGFPWAAAGPIVFAARYGAAWGLGCALLAGAAMFYLSPADPDSVLILPVLVVGTIVLCIIVGDIVGGTRLRLRQSDAEIHFLRRRLEEFSRDYHVLKVSHGQLEEFLAGQRMSLRQALQELESVLSHRDGELETPGDELMALFAQFCSVQVAGLYSARDGENVDPIVVAMLGTMGELPRDDPLLALAADRHELASLKPEGGVSNRHEDELLAVVPIVDAVGHLYGVLAVREMHFMAFQQPNLDLMALLGGYIGDMLARAQGPGLTDRERFMDALDNALKFARGNNVRSSLLFVELIESEVAADIARHLAKSIRGLDSAWLPDSVDGEHTVVILLPLMPASQCEAFLLRASMSVEEAFGQALPSVILSLRTMTVGRTDTRDSCLAFLRSGEAAANDDRNSDREPDRNPHRDSDRNDGSGVDHVA